MTQRGFRLIDISPEISPELAVFPGDTPFSNPTVVNFDNGNNYQVTQWKTTPHLGAHADAPLHYDPRGQSISNRELSYYYGPCQVIEVSLKPNERILPSTIAGKKIQAERVLFKTNSFPNPNQWNEDFNSLSPELIDYLHENKVRLVGIDTPSVDLAKDKALASHLRILKHDLANLEGLVLSHVEEGLYTLSAFPLKIKNGDASPVRAVLIQEA